jgi:RNA polymerase-binding transcription factor DksA
MPPADQLPTLRAALEEERAELLDQLAELGVGGEAIAFDENFADSGQVAAEQGETRVLVNQLQDSLNDVQRALAKLDEGTYGTCERCGSAIGDARLEAMPATRWCIACAGR